MSKYMVQRMNQARREGIAEGRRLAAEELAAVDGQEVHAEGFNAGYRDGWMAAVAWLSERVTSAAKNREALAEAERMF